MKTPSEERYTCATPMLYYLLDLAIAVLIAIIGVLGMLYLLVRGPRP
jgi:hypothetical protein